MFKRLPILVGGSSSVSITCPFSVSTSTSAESSVATVTPGTCNFLIPSNIFSNFTIAATGTYYIKLVALSNGQKITSCSIVVDTNNVNPQTPVPFALPSNVEILLAIIKDLTAYRVIGCASIFLTGIEQFRIDKNPPAEPGTLTYTPFFSWVENF